MWADDSSGSQNAELLILGPKLKGTLLGTPNREPQEYHRNIIDYKDPGKYIPIIIPTIFLGFPVWGSQ